MTDRELADCHECGMPCAVGEYHPYAACLMFKACRNSDVVRANLSAVVEHGPSLLSRPDGGDAIPQVDGLTVEREAGAVSESGEPFPDLFVIRLGDREDCVIKREQPALWAMFDAAIATEAKP